MICFGGCVFSINLVRFLSLIYFLGFMAVVIGNRVKVNVWIEKGGSLVGGMNLFSDLFGSCYCCLFFFFSCLELYAFYSFLGFYGYQVGEYGDNGRLDLESQVLGVVGMNKVSEFCW